MHGLSSMDTGDMMWCFLGIAHGFPILVRIAHKAKPDGKTPTFGLYRGWYGGYDLKRPRGGVKNVPIGRLDMKVQVISDSQNKGSIPLVSSGIAEENYWVGTSDFLGVPWEEVVTNGSPYFTDEMMQLKFTMSLKIDP